jgi:hypothetical protein
LVFPALGGSLWPAGPSSFFRTALRSFLPPVVAIFSAIVVTVSLPLLNISPIVLSVKLIIVHSKKGNSIDQGNDPGYPEEKQVYDPQADLSEIESVNTQPSKKQG